MNANALTSGPQFLVAKRKRAIK